MTEEKKQQQQVSWWQQPPPPYLWWNGKLVEWEKATVHLTMMGWPAISAVFEGIRGYWNPQQEELYIFHLDSHLERLLKSMRLMRMSSPYSKGELAEAIINLVKANGFRQDVYIQPLAYFGGGVPGYLAVLEQPGEIYIVSRPANSNLENQDRASSACISSWVRLSDTQMPPRAKTITNYQNSRLVSTEARLNGYDYGVMLNTQGKVAEAAYACIFLVREGVAITPPLTAGILESITRKVVSHLLREEMEVPVVEREVDRTELYIADEVFLCGTAVEVEPVVSVDKYKIGDGTVGPLTRRLRQLFRDVVRGYEPKFSHWRTGVYHKAPLLTP